MPRNERLKRYKHVIYIKECRPSTIVQYEQYILQRNTKMEDRGDGGYYKLDGMENWNFRLEALTYSMIEEEKTFYI